MFFVKQLPTRINRTDKILVRQEKTPVSIKRWKRFVIQLTKLLCVRDTYKTFLIYKDFPTGNFSLRNSEQKIIFVWIYRDLDILIFCDRWKVGCSHIFFVWGFRTTRFSYIYLFIWHVYARDFGAKIYFC